MRLRYVGQQPVSFMTLPSLGEVEPDAEFPVPDDVGEGLLLRADIEAVPEEDPAPEFPAVKQRKASASKNPEAAEPAGTEPTTNELQASREAR